MTIIRRHRVRAAVERELRRAPGSIERAKLSAATALCLPIEAVQDALQPDDAWCCERGENLGMRVCDECEELNYIR